MKTDLIFIVAGNYQEFLDYCDRAFLQIKGTPRAVYVSGVDRVRGIRGRPYTVIGTAWKREDFEKIIVEMKIQNNYEVQHV